MRKEERKGKEGEREIGKKHLLVRRKNATDRSRHVLHVLNILLDLSVGPRGCESGGRIRGDHDGGKFAVRAAWEALVELFREEGHERME